MNAISVAVTGLALAIVCSEVVGKTISTDQPRQGYEQKVTDPSGETQSFGRSVAISSGGLALIGAPGDPNGSDPHEGMVYAYQVSNGTWTETQEIADATGTTGEQFGQSIAISGSTAVIGANTYGTTIGGPRPSLGKAYVYHYADNVWTKTATLTASDAQPYDLFGNAVIIVGSIILIGAPQPHNLIGAGHGGAVYVFQKDSDGNWTQTQKITAPNSQPDDQFGYSIAASGNTALIGAPRLGTTYPGSIYVSTALNGIWTVEDEKQAIGGASGDAFGSAVAMNSTTAVIGAPQLTVNGHSLQGAAFVLQLSNNLWDQSQMLILANGAAGDSFGISVDLRQAQGDIIVGAPQSAFQPFNTGRALTFTQQNGLYVGSGVYAASDGQIGDSFGRAVAFGNGPATHSTPTTTPILIGAPGAADGLGNLTGAGYFYNYP